MPSTITFLGAAETVTGSRYLIETDGARVLVDCGLFQGIKSLRERNWKGMPFDASSLDAVVLTHAHIDHSGYLPKLRQLGFTGPVFCTFGTEDLLKLLLPDAGYLQEAEARRANKYGTSRHAEALPLYTRADAMQSLLQLKACKFYEEFEVAPGVTARFTRAGHIVGSACVQLGVGAKTITFTGDVGRPNDPIMLPADPLAPTDFLVTESTYGDRRHPRLDLLEALDQAIGGTLERGGVVLIPAFAVGRSQHMLHLIAELKAAGRIPDVPVYLDSPMAINATYIFRAHTEDHRLSEQACATMCEAARYTRTSDESKGIGQRRGPMIVISASGMATGGRILHHLKKFLGDANNTVVIVGFQAAGTRGRALVDGAEEIKIHGRYIPVLAEIAEVRELSAHADYSEMLDWLGASKLSPQQVFVTHGDPSAADAFRRRLTESFGWKAQVPAMGETFSLA